MYHMNSTDEQCYTVAGKGAFFNLKFTTYDLIIWHFPSSYSVTFPLSDVQCRKSTTNSQGP